MALVENGVLRDGSRQSASHEKSTQPSSSQEQLTAWSVNQVGAESQLNVMETEMLRCSAGVTRIEHVRNDTNRMRFQKNRTKVGCDGATTFTRLRGQNMPKLPMVWEAIAQSSLDLIRYTMT